MTAAEQLTIDGGSVPHPPPKPRFTPAQREILRIVRATGMIRSVDAGYVMHAHRDPPALELRRRYRSEDDRAALHRLAARGLVHRVSPGRWEPGP